MAVIFMGTHQMRPDINGVRVDLTRLPRADLKFAHQRETLAL